MQVGHAFFGDPHIGPDQGTGRHFFLIRLAPGLDRPVLFLSVEPV